MQDSKQILEMNRILRRDTPKSQSAEAQEGKYGARGDMETVTKTNDSLCDLGRVAEVYRYLEDIVEGVVALGALERRCRVLIALARRHVASSASSSMLRAKRSVSQSIVQREWSRWSGPRQQRRMMRSSVSCVRIRVNNAPYSACMHSDDQTRRRSSVGQQPS